MAAGPSEVAATWRRYKNAIGSGTLCHLRHAPEVVALAAYQALAGQGRAGSIPSDAIDGTTAIHGCSGAHRLTRHSSCDRPWPQYSARPYDTAGGIVDVLAINDRASSLRV